MEHPWFSDFNWADLETKKMEPPFRPKLVPPIFSPTFLISPFSQKSVYDTKFFDPQTAYESPKPQSAPSITPKQDEIFRGFSFVASENDSFTSHYKTWVLRRNSLKHRKHSSESSSSLSPNTPSRFHNSIPELSSSRDFEEQQLSPKEEQILKKLTHELLKEPLIQPKKAESPKKEEMSSGSSSASSPILIPSKPQNFRN